MEDIYSIGVQFFVNYLKRHESAYETPFAFSFLVTNRCFLKCKHCFYHKTLNEKSDKELSFDEYRMLSNSLDSFFFGFFAGGEPFIREDFGEIVTVFRKNNQMLVADTSTNGQLIESIVKQTEVICQADSIRPFFLEFSIEGFRDVNDEVRGRGTFDQSLETWNECKKLKKHYSNLNMGINTVVNTLNQDSLKSFLSWAAREMKPDAMNLMMTRQDPRAGKQIKAIDFENFEQAKTLIKTLQEQQLFAYADNPISSLMTEVNKVVFDSLKSGKRGFHCYAGHHGAFVNYNGDVNVCEIFPDPAAACGNPVQMANLRDFDMNFIELWNSSNAKAAKELVNSHKACDSCTHETEGVIPSIFFEPNVLNPLVLELCTSEPQMN